jgi:hypothetical protein
MVSKKEGGSMEPDWSEIRNEYISTKTSYRKLADKYGIHYRKIAKVGQREDWDGQRSQLAHRAVTKTIEKLSTAQANRAEKLAAVSDLLLDRVRDILENRPEVLEDTQAMRHISAVIRDYKEIQGIKAPRDAEEQEARIAKLRKDANEEQNKEPIRVIIGEGLDEYCN